MTIRNPKLYLASIWDWAPLDPCFPRGIKPTDIDGWVEIGGRFLIFEGKGLGVPLTEGQRRAFERMWRWNQTIYGLFNIVVIWGDAAQGRIDRLQFWPSPPVDAGWESLIEYCTGWAEWAEERADIENEGCGRQ